MTKRDSEAVAAIRETSGRLAEQYLLLGNLDAADSTDAAVELGKAMSAMAECVYRLSRAMSMIEGNNTQELQKGG